MGDFTLKLFTMEIPRRNFAQENFPFKFRPGLFPEEISIDGKFRTEIFPMGFFHYIWSMEKLFLKFRP